MKKASEKNANKRLKQRIAYILFIIATIIWGFAFVAQKAATLIPPFSVGAIRSLFASVFLFCLIPLMDRLTKSGRGIPAGRSLFDFSRRELVGGAVLGVIITVATTFQQYGLGSGTDTGKAAFITALYVVFVPIISTLFGKKPHLTSIISIPIAIVGFYFLCIKHSSALELSDALVLVCAIIFALHIISVDRLSEGCDGVRISFIQFAVAFLLNGILALIFEGGVAFSDVISVMPSLLFLGICSSGIAYTLQILGQQEVDPTISSMILSLESVFGVIGGAIFFGERMSGREYLGCAIVFFAVILAQLDVSAIKDKIRSNGGNKNE